MPRSEELRQPCPVLLPIQATWPISWPCTICYHSSPGRHSSTSWDVPCTFFVHFPLWSCPQGVQSSHALPALQKVLWFYSISSYLSAKPVRHSDMRVSLLFRKQPAVLDCDGCGLWTSGNCTLHPLVQKGCPWVNHFSRESLSDESTSCTSDRAFSSPSVCKASFLLPRTMYLVSF